MTVNRSIFSSRLKPSQLLVRDFNDGTTQGFSGGSNSSNKLFVDTWNSAIYPTFFPSEITLKGKVIIDAMDGTDSWMAFQPVQRHINANNHYYLQFQVLEDKVFVIRKVGGTDSFYSQGSITLDIGAEYAFEWKITGSGVNTYHTVTINGVVIINNAQDVENTILTSGQIGVRNNGAKGRIDDIEVLSNTVPSRTTVTNRQVVGILERAYV